MSYVLQRTYRYHISESQTQQNLCKSIKNREKTSLDISINKTDSQQAHEKILIIIEMKITMTIR